MNNGWKYGIDFEVREMIVLGDSDLLIKKAQGEWKSRDLRASSIQEIFVRPQQKFCVHRH